MLSRSVCYRRLFAPRSLYSCIMLSRRIVRHLSTACRRMVQRKGVVVGVFAAPADEEGTETAVSKDDLTSAAKKIDDASGGVIVKQLNNTKRPKLGEVRTFYGVGENDAVAVVGLGKRNAGFNEAEDIDETRENARTAAGAGVLSLRGQGVLDVQVEGFGVPDAAGEGATLALFSYDQLKSKEQSRKPLLDLSAFHHSELLDFSQSLETEAEEEKWKEGVVMAEGQNIARELAEGPANIVNPTYFAQYAKRIFEGMEGVKIYARDKEWAKSENMNAFLSVAQGSAQPPVFLQIDIPASGQTECAKEGRIVFVGKGVCFDSGGISLKPGANMDLMRGDMGGAAAVLAAAYTARRLGCIPPQGLTVLTPLVENMPGGHATRPGDIVVSRSGLSVKIDNTDAEGRLILCDALSYANDFKPSRIIDAATLTGACHIALGGGAAAVFTNNKGLFKDLYKAATVTGDRVWRMPVYQHYTNRMKADFADLNNIGKANSGGGSCTAAAFLKEFVNCDCWAHLDIAGVCGIFNDGEIAYINKGMTGRPTRTLVQWLKNLC